MYNVSSSINLTTDITYHQCKAHIHINSSVVTQNIDNIPCLEGYEFDSNQETFVTEWNLVCGKIGLGPMTQMMVTLGQLVGAIVFPSISDRYGRKPVLTFSLFMCTALSISAGFAPNYIVYVILRFLFGTTQQGYILTTQVYVTEIFPKEQRGLVSAFGGMGWSVTMVLLSFFGYLLRNVSWRNLHWILGLGGVPTLFTYWIIDESLRWLVANNRIEESKKLVQKIAKINNIASDDIVPLLDFEKKTGDSETEVLKTKKNKERENILSIFKHKTLLKTASILTFTWITNAMTYFGLTLNSAQLAGNRFLNFFIYQAVEVPSLLTFFFLVTRLRRRQLSMLFHGIAGVSLVISAVIGSFKAYSEKFTTAAIALSFVGKFGISASFSTIFLFTPELYPTNLRNIGIGIGSSSGRLGGVLAPYASLLAAYIDWGPGVIFGVCCVTVTLLQLLLPEPSAKEMPQTLEELKAWRKQDNKGDKR